MRSLSIEGEDAPGRCLDGVFGRGAGRTVFVLVSVAALLILALAAPVADAA